MPTYEYSCQKCGQTFEAFQSMRDEPFRECPKELCRLPKWGHGKVKRLLGTGAGLIFKGSGFYSTDYRSESYKAAAKKESAPKLPKEATNLQNPSQQRLLRRGRRRQPRRNQKKNPPDIFAAAARISSARNRSQMDSIGSLNPSAIFVAAR